MTRPREHGRGAAMRGGFTAGAVRAPAVIRNCRRQKSFRSIVRQRIIVDRTLIRNFLCGMVIIFS